MLHTNDVEVVCVNSITEAEGLMQTGFSPYLVFLDNNLPDGPGIDYLRRLKADHYNKEVIMMTADYSDSLGELAISRGAYAFLEKPFSYRKVSELMEQVYKPR